MVNSKVLASSLVAAAGLGSKQASALTPLSDMPVADVVLQEIVGEPNDRKSTFAQTSPAIGNTQIANPFTPFQGDDVFFTYLIPGVRFQSHDGQWFEIDSYDAENEIEIHNVWYPRQRGVVSVQTLRKAIFAWIHPVQVTLPPIPVGVDYGTLDVKVQN